MYVYLYICIFAYGNEAIKDRKENDSQIEKEVVVREKIKQGVDAEAKWIIKDKKIRYGYKQHTATYPEGLVLEIITTPANQSDIKHLEDVLEVVNPTKVRWVKADKCYKSDKVIRSKNLKNHIMRKAAKSKKLTEFETKFNKRVSIIRYKVERTFGSI